MKYTLSGGETDVSDLVVGDNEFVFEQIDI